jgi:dTMP kinase
LSRGVFVTFEGGEGAGKSTQIRILAQRLRAMGREVVETAEPGGTAIGRQIRRVFLDAGNGELTPEAELLLVFAARSQNVKQVIRPALEGGRIVLCDRFTDSTRVYQGVGRGLGLEVVEVVDRIACGGLGPDLTLLLDVPVEAGMARARERNARGGAAEETRLDEEAPEFHRRVREAYLEFARKAPERIRVIDAAGSVEEVAARVWESVAGSGVLG